MTPIKLHRINPSISNLCWRGCGKVGSFVHCWWECPKVQQFWKEVQSQIVLITGHPLTLWLNLFLLSYWSIPLDTLTMELIDLGLAAARNIIALHWKSNKAPSISDWFLKLWDFFLQDKISVSILHSENQPVIWNFQEKWLPLLEAASTHHIDTTLFDTHIHHNLL